MKERATKEVEDGWAWGRFRDHAILIIKKTEFPQVGMVEQPKAEKIFLD